MSKGDMRVNVWNEEGYDLAVSSGMSAFFVCFPDSPKIHSTIKVNQQSGETLSQGDRVSFIGSNKTSAGFDNFHLNDEGYYEYVGIYETAKKENIILWQPYIGDKKYAIEREEYEKMYYGHYLEYLKDDPFPGAVLLYTNMSGAGRVVETKILKKPTN